MENGLIDKFITASKTFNNLITSFDLISKYNGKDLLGILSSIVEDYTKINSICKEEKKSLNLEDYIIQKEKDDSSKLKKYINIILTQKKENSFEAICININFYNFYITHKYSVEFLNFIGLKLIETSINFNNLKDFLKYTSNLNERKIVPFLEAIKNNCEQICTLCKNENKYIDISQYISFNKEDDLYKMKELILFIIEKEKSFSYNFIKINHALFVPYLDPNSLDEIKIIREIYTELVALG